MNYASQFTIQSVHGYGRFEKRVSSEVKMLCYMYIQKNKTQIWASFVPL